MPLSRIFQLYLGGQFIDGGNRSTHIFQLYLGGQFIDGGNLSTQRKPRPVASHWQILSHAVVSSTLRLNGIRTHNISGGVSRTNDEIPEIARLPVHSRAGVYNLSHLDILTCNDPHSYFSGFFITVNRSKQTMGDHLKTLVSSFYVRFISNRKSFLPCQLQQERGLCLDQAAV